MQRYLKLVVPAICSLCLLTACGGGGSDGGSVEGGAGAGSGDSDEGGGFEGRVVDAPMAGAAVFIDLNGNNQLDADEPSGTTDANGYFDIDLFTPVAGIVPKIISIGGTDSKTGAVLPNLALVSDVPADLSQAVNVTPLTTLLASVDTLQAKAQLLAALGVSGTPEALLTTDGWAEAEAGDEDAKAAQRVNQQLGLLLQTATTLTDAEPDDAVALAQSVANLLATMAQQQGNIDLTSPANIQSILTQVIAQAVAEAMTAVDIQTVAIAAVAASVANANTIAADLALDPVSDIALEIVISTQESLQTSIAELVAAEVNLNDFLEQTSLSQLFVDVVIAVGAPDNDNDGVPDLLDPDDDNDDVRDSVDAFPSDSTESLDTDGDGMGNNADTDDDDDGIVDTVDGYPLVSIGTLLDTDADGRPNDCDSACQELGMAADTDDDGDNSPDADDGFPLISTGILLDTDLDGIPDDCDSACLQLGMLADADDDADGVLDYEDPFPKDGSIFMAREIPSIIEFLR